MVDSRVTSLTSSLKALIRLQHRSHAVLEAELGWKTGMISRLLSGRSKLTVRHVVLLLRVMHVPLDQFASVTFGSSRHAAKRPKPRRLFGGSGLWDPWDL
jgi:hypothetical protein